MISHPVQLDELKSSLRMFRGYLEDLERVNFDGSSTKLQLVINCAQKDSVLWHLAELFRSRFSQQHFVERLLSGEPIDTPKDPVAALAFAYDLLVHVKVGRKVSLRELLTRSDFSGGGMDQRWAMFVRRFVTPLREAVASLLAWVEGWHHEVPGLVEPHDLFVEGLRAVFGGASALVGGPAPAPAAAPATAEAVQARAGAVAALEARVRAAGLDARRREDLLVDVDLLELELRKDAPASARLGELADGFAAAGFAAEAQACLPGEAPRAAPTVSPPASSARPAPARVAPPGGGDERAALDAERAALAAERKALSAQRAALDADRAALAAEREAFAAQRRAYG